MLNRFYYAHKISTNAENLGIPRHKLVNVWFKEYLLQAHSRLPSFFCVESFKPFYRTLWELGSIINWQPADVLHIMCHGGGRRLIGRAKTEGSVVIGEPVNAHPDVQNEILNSEYDRLKIKRLYKRTLAQTRILEEIEMADRLVVASNFLKRSYVENGYPAEAIDVLPYGVDLSRFSAVPKLNAEQDKFRVICVAGISVRKGIIDLLDAWKIFGPAKGELILIGRISSEMVDILKPYEPYFKHIPFVPNHELKNYLSASTVFVLPSLEDGFGLVCSEAMACGLPVIATHNTGAAELIEDEINGYVVPIRSPQIIADKLEMLYRDREKAHVMGCNAADKVRSMHDWAGYAEKLIAYYKSSLK